jgi:hypothetical protein
LTSRQTLVRASHEPFVFQGSEVLPRRSSGSNLNLVPSSDGCDDFVGVLGPGKGFRIRVGVAEEAVDGKFEFLDGSEDASLGRRLMSFAMNPSTALSRG